MIQITVYFGPQSYNVNSGNIPKFIKAAKEYNESNKYHSDLYYLGVNNDGKIRAKTLSDCKAALGAIEDEKCFELLEEVSKFTEKKAEQIVRSIRKTPAEKSAAQAETLKKLIDLGWSKAEAEKMAKAV